MSARVAARTGTFEIRFWYEEPGRTVTLGPAAEVVELRRDLPRALSFVRALATSPGALLALRGLLAREDSALLRADDAEVIRAVAVHLISGRMVAARLPNVPLGGLDVAKDEVEAEPEPERKKRTQKTWIEIELLDTDGNPVPNERYWIELPDGAVREGRLNELGRAYFGELDPGECTVRFPDLDDEAAVSPKPAPLPPPPERPKKTWIEIQLVAEDGRPMAGELYKIGLPGGEIREGRLDAGGQARVLDIEPGDCRVMFPAFEEEAVERL